MLARSERGPRERRAELGVRRGIGLDPGGEQLADELRVPDPARVVDERPGRGPADDSAELRADELEHESGRAVQCSEDEHLLRVRVELSGQIAFRPLAARDRGDRQISHRDRRRAAQRSEHLGVVGPPAQHGVLIRRAQRDVAAPELASGPVDVGAVLDQEPERLRAAAPPHGVREDRPLVRVGAGFEQQAHVLEPVVVECVRQRVGVAGLRARRRGARAGSRCSRPRRRGRATPRRRAWRPRRGGGRSARGHGGRRPRRRAPSSGRARS